MPDGERRPVSLLGRRKLGDALSESGAAGLCLSCEEFCHPSQRAAAKDGRQLAETGDAICRYSIRRLEHDSLRGVVGAHRLSPALLSDNGWKNSAPGGRG